MIDPVWDKLYCLTLPGQRERQQSARGEFLKAGLPPPEFFHGVSPQDQAITQLYATNQVTTFPPCFRCAKLDCGKADCNNVLLPVQVAVIFSFRAILQTCIDEGWSVIAICEDDIVFAEYAGKVFSSARFRTLVDDSGLRSETPTLIQLGSPTCPTGFFDNDCPQVELTDHLSMSNYMFVCNAAFATLAIESLSTFNHTADTLIHERLIDQASCFALKPKLVCDRSWGLRNAPSQIHPKHEYVEYLRLHRGPQSLEFQRELARLHRHRKRVDVYTYGFVGFPNLDENSLRQACRQLGADLGADSSGKDGYVAWDNVLLERLDLVYRHPAPDRFFQYAKTLCYVVPDPVECIYDLARRIRRQDESVQMMERVIAATSGPQEYGETANDAVNQAAWLFIHWSRLLRRYSQGRFLREGDEIGLLRLVKQKSEEVKWTMTSVLPNRADELALAGNIRGALEDELAVLSTSCFATDR